MSTEPEQKVHAISDHSHIGWKRRAATAVLGENAARKLAGSATSFRALARRNLTREGRANRRKLESFRDSHAGQQCVIIGNGPSLRNTEMSLLKGVPTFGLNRIYLMHEELGFTPTYHVVVNQLVVEQCADELLDVQSPLFTTDPNRTHLGQRDNIQYLAKLVGPHFGTDVTRGIWEGATVTYVAMQLAYFMGFEKVVLVGVDHSFAVKGPAHRVVESDGADHSHFDPRYFGKGFRWQLPDLETSELAYALARRTFEASGRSIVDATVGGKLEVFPKAVLKDALS